MADFEPSFFTNISEIQDPNLVRPFYPVSFTNVSTVNVALATSISYPDIIINDSEIFYIVNTVTSRPTFFDNAEIVFAASIDATDYFKNQFFFENVSQVFGPQVNCIFLPDFITNTNSIFTTSNVENVVFFPEYVTNLPVFFTHIIKNLPYNPPIEPPVQVIRNDGILPKCERNTTDKYRIYKDFGWMFRPHPLTGDITRVFDYDSITQSLKVILFTDFYERPFSSQLVAGNVRSKLFNLSDNTVLREIQEDISLSLLKHEPRIITESVDVVANDSLNAVNVTIIYKIRTFEQSETFTLFIERI